MARIIDLGPRITIAVWIPTKPDWRWHKLPGYLLCYLGRIAFSIAWSSE